MTLSDYGVNLAVDHVCGALNDGTLCLYAGNTCLATLRFSDPAFHPAVGGVAEAHPLTPDPSAQGGGKATRFCAVSANGMEVWEGTVGKGKDLELTEYTIEVGSLVSITDLIYRQDA